MSERCNKKDVGMMGNCTSQSNCSDGGGPMNQIIVHDLVAVLLRSMNQIIVHDLVAVLLRCGQFE